MSYCKIFGRSLVCVRKASDVVYKDVIRLSLKAGNGGQGLPRYNGVGGKGGSIYVIPERNVQFQNVYDKYRDKGWVVKAEAGQSAQKIKLVGNPGKEIVIKVPLGVECVDIGTKILLARCVTPGRKLLIARGGHGGNVGNNYKGQPGEHISLAIHLKLNTNIGLLGLPNAGKSTLLKAFVPKSKVKIANYPFTTINPQVLDLEYEQDPDEYKFSLSVADLPGIIEGASRNRGRGHAFLKHLEYSDMIVMVVDLNGFQLSNDLSEPFRNALESVSVLCQEMENYDARLTRKPLVVALNKVDLFGQEKAHEIVQKLKSKTWWNEVPEEIRPTTRVKFVDVIPISARSKQVDELKECLRQVHDNLNEPKPMAFKKHETESGEIMI
ncbi:unnamed protein product [Bursaphelenchus okinawaensis]|uniref:OBG-type G domain-containing protein n=1 Tax=Bursaphelenchus okinawaensis TaxID=465554 RepID=A0A811L0K4_9BILA|nr:unnamed protein product [Bursaphelenchus okinawaensis]CAG9115508.1 unnamed protein product [Bursaphelenchus okinawaensis]